MTKLNVPYIPKKGGLGVLALFGILFITLIFAFYFRPADEIVAKPTIAEQTINEAVTQLADNEVVIPVPKVTGVVSLDDPRPKIDPQLVKELKELKRQKKHKRVTVLVELKDERALEAIRQAGGIVQQNFDIGNIAVVEVQSDNVEKISEATGVEQVASEKEYVALLADRIPAFSIDTAAWENNITGKGVKIAILDTGVGPHNKITVAEGASFVDGEDTTDQNGHGTHVAGIAYGVAKDSAIYNAKVLNKAGAGTTSQIIAGINWAVENNVDIISMSFGGMFTELDGPLASAVKEAINNGVIFVVASGNCKTGCGGFYGVTTPGNVKEVITIGAVDNNNVVASFSSGDTFGEYIKPDVTAPGIDITSTWLNNGEKTSSGTSMSTPFVAGVAALLLEKEPGLTNEQVKQKLEATATDVGETGKDVLYGRGIISVASILSSNYSTPETPPQMDDTDLPPSDLSKYTLHEITGGASPEYITTDCPESLAYSTELNLSREEFYMAYEYCILQIENKVPELPTPDHYQNITDTSEYIRQAPRIYFENWQSYIPAGDVNETLIQELKLKVRDLQSFDFKTLANPEPLFDTQNHIEVDYDDNYNVFLGSNDDGVVWGGSTLSGRLQEGSSSPTNAQVICYDWCSEFDSAWDHCFSTSSTGASRSADFSACRARNSIINSVCSANNCAMGQAEGEHSIGTGSSGSREKCTVRSFYVTGCSSAYTLSGTFSATHYTISPRQFWCANSDTAYDDVGRFGNNLEWILMHTISCGTGNKCDATIDADNSDFGTSGTSVPSSLCRIDNGQSGCSQNSQCLAGSHCTSSHCCLNGQEWDGTGCSIPGTCTAGFNGNKRCSGNTPQWQYQNSDCSTTWQNQAACSTGTTCQNGDCVSTCNSNGLCESGETKPGCPSDCNKSIGAICTANNQCSTNFCDGNTGTCQAPTTCTDGDQDGYGNPGSATCSAGSTLLDCDDIDPFINPGAIEQCNGKDDNCNGQTDEGGVCTPQPTCNDQDQDGYGSPATGCPQTLPDCDDSKSNIHPNAPEICDGFDNDCDGSIDEANVCCGNQQCDTGLGENLQSCAQDCYSSYQITGIQSPSSVNQGQTVQVTASIKNTGTWPGTTNVEGGIIPDGWLPFSSSKCCGNNNFFGTQQTTIQPGQTNNIQFTLTAPGVTTKDSCGGQSAWDTSHEITIGLYDNCGNTYQLKSNQDIKIQDKPCSKPSDCALPAEKCVILSTTGTCQANTCTNLCTSGQYACSGETVRHCEDTNSDGCYEWKDTTVCAPGQTCVPGQSSCTAVQISTEPFIEESAGGQVYKQIGDTVILNLKFFQQEQISLYYDSNQFELDATTCQQTFTIDKDTACKFKVKIGLQGAELGVRKQNTIKPAKATVVTINNHNGIIITNKKKLKERFAGQEISVQNLLNDAYNFADDNNLIIYDLQELPVIHPWANFPTYQETIANPFMVDNTLAVEIGKFIRKKCIPPQCQSTLILGDDYVVPHYRRYTQFLNSYFFSPAINTQLLYSEIPYVERTTKEFSQLDEVLSDDNIAKQVVIIKPDSLSTEMRTAVNRLKATLQANFSSSITEKDSSNVTCNDPQLFNNLNGVTIIILGTEQNNRAYNCMPFVAGLENRDSAFLEVNPWDGGEYSIVINTENPKIIETFSDVLRTGVYKKIIGRHWYFIEMAVTAASFVAMACGPIPCDYVVDSIDAGIQCGVKEDALMCGVSTGVAILPIIPSGPVKLVIKAFIHYVGPAGEAFILKYGPGAVTFFAGIGGKFDDFKAYLKKAVDYFDVEWNVIIKNFNTPADEEALAFGIKNIEAEGKTLQAFESALSKQQKARILHSIGKYSSEFFAQKGWKQFDKLDKRLYRVDLHTPDFIKNAGGWTRTGGDDYVGYVKQLKNGRFVATSRYVSGAFHGAKSAGSVADGGTAYVYIIDPRTRNYIDALETVPNPGSNMFIESEVTAVDNIDWNDVVGTAVWKDGDDLPRSVSPNPSYKGSMSLNNLGWEVD